MEKYYTPEQLQYLEQRRETVGEERIREVEAEWPRLQEEVRVAMRRGEDPTSETAQQLARRWMRLVEEFTGGDPGIRDSLNQIYQQESQVHGVDVEAMRPMMEWVQRAHEASQS